MADNIQFSVDAVLGDTSMLEQQIRNLRTNLNLTINNTQALRSIKEVQTSINRMYGDMQSSDIAKRLGLQQYDTLDQKVQELANNMQKITKQTMTTDANGNLTGAIIEYKDSLGNTTTETLKWQTVSRQVVNGVVTENQKLVTTQMKYVDAIEKTEQAQQKLETTRQNLQWQYGDVKATGVTGVSDIANTDWFKSLGDTAQIVGGTSRSVNSLGDYIEKTSVRVKNANNQWEHYNATVNTTSGELHILKGRTQDVINHQMNLTTMLSSAIERFAVWGVAMAAWTGIGNAISDCVGYVKELDTAMTNIRVVTMGTKEETQQLLDTYNQIGQDFGASTTDVAEGAVDWLRQGFSETDTTELVKDSVILSKLALIDNADATQYLTSALKGYKLEAKDAIGVIDQLVSIDLEAATSAGDMAEAMSRTANMARTTGVEMNELLGLIATISEVTQNSASTVGNAMKTIFSRMSNVKAGVTVDENGESLNDVEKVLNKIGVALRDNDGEWRDFYEVLDEIANKWDSLSSTQQSQVTTAIGGTRQRENILVAFENWDKVKQYAETGANASGTAMEKYGIVLESVEAKQAQLTAKIQEFYSSVLNSGLIVALIDVAQKFMDIANAGDGVIGKILLLTSAFVGLNVVWKSLQTTTLITNLLSLLKTIASVSIGVFTLNGSFLDLGTKGIGALLLSIPKAIVGLISLTAHFGLAQVSAWGLKGCLELLNINPVMLAISALVAVVAGGVAIFNHFNVTLEEQHEKAKQAQSDYAEVADELQSVNEELSTTKQRIAELESKDSLTFVEQEELDKLKKTNEELEKQSYWLEKSKQQKQKDVDSEAQKAWDKDFNDNNQEFVSRYNFITMPNSTTPTGVGINESTYIQEQIKYYNELENKIQELANKKSQWTEEEAEQYNTLVEEQEKTKSYLESVGTRIQTDFIDAYDVSDDVKQEWIELQNIIRQAIDPDYAVKQFESAIESLPDKIKENFTAADNAGNFKTLEEAFTIGGKVDTTNLEKFKDVLKEIGVEASDPTVLNYLNSLADATQNIDVTPLMSYSEIINDVKDKAESLKKAQDELSDTGYMTADTVVELEKQFGNLNQYLTLTANGYQISKAGLDALNSSMFTQYETALSDAKQAALTVLDQEHKKGLSYASTTAEIQKQLEAQLALARVASTQAQQDYTALGIGGSGLKDYKPYTDALEQENAIQSALDNLKNSQANLDRAKQVVGNISLKGSNGSGSGSSSKSSKEWWETQLENLKDDLDYNVITIDAYIGGIQNILNKLKKGSDAWKEVNQELQKARLDRVKDQFDRSEITIDQYIAKLQELRKAYKANTEGYKELTDLINDAKYDKFSSQYERGEITANQYIAKLKELQKQYAKGSEEFKKLADEIDDIELEKTEKFIENLQDSIDKLDQKISELGEVNTDKESVKYAQLLSQKYIQIKNNIATIQKELKRTNLTQEQRNNLQEELNDLLTEEVDVRDEIEEQVKTYYENQKEQAEQQAELTKKQALYNKELELYGEKGKELYEWETNKKIDAIEEQIELREAEKEALEEINEKEELENNLLEAKLKLQNALNNKTTKILTKQSDGTWQYEYSANMSDVQDAQKEVEDAEQALKDYDFEQGIKDLQEEADKLQNSMDDLAEKYEEAEFWADREYEKTMNAIADAFNDIDSLVEEWMSKYSNNSATLTSSYQKLVSANNKLQQSLIDLANAIDSKYETVGSNQVISKDGVKSFGTGGNVVGHGLIFAHDKERVLTKQQNIYFEQLVNKLPQLLKTIDITKFNGYVGISSGNLKNNIGSGVQNIIDKVECIFPNITTTDGLQEAILELPRLALQKSN